MRPHTEVLIHKKKSVNTHTKNIHKQPISHTYNAYKHSESI